MAVLIKNMELLLEEHKTTQQLSRFISSIDSRRIEPVYCEHGPFPPLLADCLSSQKSDEIIQMASGNPDKEAFCVKNITINHSLKIGKKHFNSDRDGSLINTVHLGDAAFAFNNLKDHDLSVAEEPIESVFRYSPNTYGLASSLDLYSNIIQKFDYFGENRINRNKYDVMLTSGTSASTFYLTHMLCDENKTVLIEEFTYPAIMSNISLTNGHFAPFNLNMNANAENNENPIDVVYLRNLLENWFQIYPNKPYPTVLYTITIQNPLCFVQTLKHKKEVYDLCLKFGVMIIEDDPYGTISLSEQSLIKNDDTLECFNHKKSQYLSTVAKNSSYLAVDTDGIVIRCESASKIFAPGLRVGFIVAHKFFIKKLISIVECGIREISGPSMTIFNQCCFGMDKLLAVELKTSDIQPLDGWIQWSMNVSELYSRRHIAFSNALQQTEAWKNGLFSIMESKFGIFLCIKLNFEKKKPQVLESAKSMKHGMQYMDYKLLENHIDSIAGTKFAVNVEHSYKKCGFIRFTFAGVSEEMVLNKAATNIGEAIEKFFDEYLTENQQYEVFI